MIQSFADSSTAGQKGWNKHVCVNYRSSTDSQIAMTGIAAGNEIKFRAGYNIYQGPQATTTVKTGQSNKLFTYTV